jgi:glutathione synthase
MKLLFIIDPLEQFKTHKDSSFAMMREAAKRGDDVWICQIEDIAWSEQHIVAGVRELTLSTQAILSQAGECLDSSSWYSIGEKHQQNLAAFDAVLMRKDPPFDLEYIYATYLLEHAQRLGARILNAPEAIRNHSEKLSLMEFSEFAPPTLVTRDIQRIRAFHAQERDIIIKPLDGMGGMGVFRVGADGLNLGSIVETLGDNGRRTLMVQRYLPEITQGDKRILLINGEAVPFALARIPQNGEVRGNLAAGGMGKAQPLSAHDWKIAQTLGPVLAKRGLFLVGLDVIGDTLTEINVTSPTCFQEITAQSGFDVAAMWRNALAA